ncbi:hypothetical protein [uncultured Desulfovibrio sp.]|jgi:hypothetical protein|uniref:hypothetical protein n=1 Tax=uncultured Desulfovibrio sp. TaxID=167968 RepID=UPI00262E80BC|nr:hypothetical protein [uncultured Desulfovibrio sp.]
MTSDNQEKNQETFAMDFSNGKDISLPANDSSVRLETQKIFHRRFLFWTCLGICAVLYLLFGILVIRAWWSDAFFQILLAHKHIGAFILALLIVPSALLWGLLRAAYMPETAPKEADNLVKTASSLHPLGDG